MDNLYKEGTLITAKASPDRHLMINRYYKRIYYCTPVNEPMHKLLAYFERELRVPLNKS